MNATGPNRPNRRSLRLLALALALAAALSAAGCAVAPTPDAASAALPTVDATTSADRPAAGSVSEDTAVPASFGSAGAAEEADPTLAEMLTYAIQDEYLARAEYEAIVSRTTFRNPFFGISRAEAGHVALLEPLFAAYGVALPADDAAARVTIPAGAADAYEAGVAAEIANIAMYERFLALELPDDVRSVFEQLAAASRSHLDAFRRNLDRVT